MNWSKIEWNSLFNIVKGETKVQWTKWATPMKNPHLPFLLSKGKSLNESSLLSWKGKKAWSCFQTILKG